jgi:hypothetical protein
LRVLQDKAELQALAVVEEQAEQVDLEVLTELLK